MFSNAQIEQFDRDGFINGGKVISDADLDELTAQLGKIIDKGPDGFGPGEAQPVLFRDLTSGYLPGKNVVTATPVWQIVNIWEAAPAFEKLLYHPRVVEGITELTKMKDLMIWHDQVQYKPANAGGSTGWHQDAPLWPTIMPMTPVSAWIPFDDAGLDNGCMWMMPGSHKWGDQIKYLGTKGQLKEFAEFDQVGEGFQVPGDASVKNPRPVPWPVKRGEVSFHHSLTWHGSPTNKSPRPRRAIAIHYMTGQAYYVGKRGHPMEQFINLPDGAPMAQAGEHFPTVCRDGKAVAAPKLSHASR